MGLSNPTSQPNPSARNDHDATCSASAAAHNQRAIAKARTLDCDVVILDLEDAVAPNTEECPNTAKAAIRDGGFDPREIAVRVKEIEPNGTSMI